MAIRGAVSTAALAAVTLAGAGAVGGYLVRPADVPDRLRAAPEATTAPVGQEELTDERTVKVSLVTSAAVPLVSGVTGRVTQTWCRAGAPLRSGQVVARVNDTPLIALATSMPLYRDLASGDRGPDVLALQHELTRLGYRVRADGKFGAATRSAMKRLQKASGIGKPAGTVKYGAILWLPAAAVTPDSCKFNRGASVSAGATVATAPARLSSVVVKSLPTTLVPGPRVIRLMGVTGPLNGDGTGTEAGFLAKVARTRDYQVLQSSDKNELSATIALKDGLQTLKVPPGGLFDVDGDSGCLQSESRTYRVRIVGSRLGAALVVPAPGTPDPAPTAVNLGSSITSGSCGS